MRRVALAAAAGAAVLAALPLARRAWTDFENWRTVQNDPSAREAYLTFLQVDVSLLMIVIVAAGLIVLSAFRRPASSSAQRSD